LEKLKTEHNKLKNEDEANGRYAREIKHTFVYTPYYWHDIENGIKIFEEKFYSQRSIKQENNDIEQLTKVRLWS
jgi:hypothetical protein